MLGFALPVNPPAGNWYQQFMPNLGTKQINDIIFLDSLTGFAVAKKRNLILIPAYLKTTNGGDNWIIFTQTKDSTKVKFINSTTGFVCGGSSGSTT